MLREWEYDHVTWGTQHCEAPHCLSYAECLFDNYPLCFDHAEALLDRIMAVEIVGHFYPFPFPWYENVGE